MTCILLNIDIFEINRVIFSNLSTEGPVTMKLRGPGLRSHPSIPASPSLLPSKLKKQRTDRASEFEI